MDESTSGDRVRRALTREVATHRRAVELHEGAVAKLTESGHFQRAQAAGRRLAYARKRLQEALAQERLLLRQGYAAMATGPGRDEVAHAVPDGQPTSLCGREATSMVGVAEDFGALPPARQCPDCVRAIDSAG